MAARPAGRDAAQGRAGAAPSLHPDDAAAARRDRPRWIALLGDQGPGPRASADCGVGAAQRRGGPRLLRDPAGREIGTGAATAPATVPRLALPCGRRCATRSYQGLARYDGRGRAAAGNARRIAQPWAALKEIRAGSFFVWTPWRPLPISGL